MLLQEIADIISKHAGWKNKTPDKTNTILFELNDGLSLNIHSPNGRTLIFYALITKLPNDEYKAGPIIEKNAKYAVAACKKRKSIISIHENNLMLHRNIDHNLEALEITQEAKYFLNDLVWWRNQLSS